PLEGVGRGLSERVVEIPWILRSLPAGPNVRVLDVGTAFAPIVYKRLLLGQTQTIETVDLAENGVHGLIGHVADVRDLPFADDSYDVATCISTLEHIGMDNEHYRIESGGGDDVTALRELGRVAGRVLLTVPGGADANLGWLRQYQPSTFRERAAEASLSVQRMEVYAHDPVLGWGPVDEGAVGDRHFGDGVFAAAAVICADLSHDRQVSGKP
ncbi:MAG TPA: class I SAM-dependent methyltransferase, partial [Solirubrobacteraceae bacterium]|nr:class I SAM-dependent methyltransferase [Solirubrobacteraceae bacterium]